MRPVLLLEVNEVPLRVFRKYSADPRFPNLRKFVESSLLVETLITDEGELSPWCTWPTIHRGLKKKDHGILHLGQDPATFHGTPIWEEYLKRGESVGVFGSLQSWPAKEPGSGGFYVPDTFSATSECHPAWIEPIQSFNLGLVRENGREMSKGLSTTMFRPKLWVSLLRAGIRPRTLLRSAVQIVRERVNPAFRQRRVSFQAQLFWDIFRRLYSAKNPPAFSSFFTNHIASVEHRYWHHVFPEDFKSRERPVGQEHAATMDYAVKILDEILAEAMEWRRQNPELILIVANSMGQGPRVSKQHQGFELMIKDIPRLFSLLGIPAGVKQNLAMAPQLTFDVGSHIDPNEFIRLLDGVTCLNGRKLLYCDHQNRTVTVTVFTPPAEEIECNRVLVAGRELPFSETGISRISIEPGTAYHVPEGLIFVQGISGDAIPAQQPIPAESAKALMLSWAGF